MVVSEVTEVKPFAEKKEEESENKENSLPETQVVAPVVTLETLKRRIAEKKQERLRSIVAKINMKLPNALTNIAEREQNKVTLWRTWKKKDETVLLENKDNLRQMLHLPVGVELQVKKPKRAGLYANVYAYIR